MSKYLSYPPLLTDIPPILLNITAQQDICAYLTGKLNMNADA